MLPFGSPSVGWLYLRKRGQWLDKSGLVEMPYNRVRVVSAACIVVHWRNGSKKGYRIRDDSWGLLRLPRRRRCSRPRHQTLQILSIVTDAPSKSSSAFESLYPCLSSGLQWVRHGITPEDRHPGDRSNKERARERCSGVEYQQEALGNMLAYET